PTKARNPMTAKSLTKARNPMTAKSLTKARNQTTVRSLTKAKNITTAKNATNAAANAPTIIAARRLTIIKEAAMKPLQNGLTEI
ncbi:hypothetical protein, partial [Bacillus licheniformis]